MAQRENVEKRATEKGDEKKGLRKRRLQKSTKNNNLKDKKGGEIKTGSHLHQQPSPATCEGLEQASQKARTRDEK